MVHIHDVYDTNRHFAIDPVTRTITYAESVDDTGTISANEVT